MADYGTYTRDGQTRHADTPAEAMQLEFDGWIKQPETDAGTGGAPAPAHAANGGRPPSETHSGAARSRTGDSEPFEIDMQDRQVITLHHPKDMPFESLVNFDANLVPAVRPITAADRARVRKRRLEHETLVARVLRTD